MEEVDKLNQKKSSCQKEALEEKEEEDEEVVVKKTTNVDNNYSETSHHPPMPTSVLTKRKIVNETGAESWPRTVERALKQQPKRLEGKTKMVFNVLEFGSRRSGTRR